MSLVVLGCGFTGAALARRRLARAEPVRATVRRETDAISLRAMGIDARALPALTRDDVDALVVEGDDVAVCFPPDGVTDRAIAPAVKRARAVAYVSTTGVYGERAGRVDEDTPVDARGEKARARLDAEDAWRAVGATVLRAAGIYGPWRGLHRRVLSGGYRVPGDGARVVSRVHVEDLAALLDAALSIPLRDKVFVVADDTPVPQVEVVRWLSEALGVAMPASAPLDAVSETLRHDRAVDNARVKAATGVRLAYPGYREGFTACLRVEGFAQRA